ncbi:MAG: hypothetical protein HC822_14775 [Oscillochloris sp.]|nr:hypothetical protein [Oscillochloris sp.]
MQKTPHETRPQNWFQPIAVILILVMASFAIAACGTGESRADRTGIGDEEGVGAEGIGVDDGLNFSEETAAEEDNLGADAGLGVNEGIGDDDNLGVGEGPGTTGGLGADDGLIAEEGLEEDDVLGVEGDFPAETVANILADPSAFYGNLVMVEAEIGTFIGNSALTIEEANLLADDTLPVLDTRGLIPTLGLSEDDAVAVRGTVAAFNRAEIEQTYGLDLGDTLYSTWEGRPVIIADSIAPLDEGGSGLGG